VDALYSISTVALGRWNIQFIGPAESFFARQSMAYCSATTTSRHACISCPC
jgi:hypothetical protein